MTLLWKVIDIFMCADTYTFKHIHIHIYIHTYTLGEEGEEYWDKLNHVTTDSFRSASGLLKLSSFIRHREWLEESGTCCSLDLFSNWKWLRSIGFLWWTSKASDGHTWANFGEQNCRWPLLSVGPFKTSLCVRTKTSLCEPATRAHVFQRVGVVPTYSETSLNVHTGAFFGWRERQTEKEDGEPERRERGD